MTTSIYFFLERKSNELDYQADFSQPFWYPFLYEWPMILVNQGFCAQDLDSWEWS